MAQHNNHSNNNNGNRGGNHQRKNREASRPITSTLGNLEPNVVGFTIEGSDLERMAMEYLKADGHNVLKSIVTTKDTGRGELVLRQYVFFDRSDKAIQGGGGRSNGGGTNLNPAMARKMPTGGVRLSNELFQSISSIALPDNQTRAIPGKNNLVVIEVDPISITGLLLDVEPGIHRIIITKVEKARKSILIDVYKRLEANEFDPGANLDRFTQALNYIR